MLLKIQGYANAQAVFDVLSRDGVSWGEPTKKGDSWHTLRVNVKPEEYEKTKAFIKDCFPKARISFK